MAQLIFFNSMLGLPISLLIKYIIWIADDWSIATRISLFVLSLLIDILWIWAFKSEFLIGTVIDVRPT